jgi:hypothetical protein
MLTQWVQKGNGELNRVEALLFSLQKSFSFKDTDHINIKIHSGPKKIERSGNQQEDKSDNDFLTLLRSREKKNILVTQSPHCPGMSISWGHKQHHTVLGTPLSLSAGSTSPR